MAGGEGAAGLGGVRFGRFETLALFFGALLQFLLQFFLVLFEDLRIDRRSIEGPAETRQRDRKGNFVVNLVLDRDTQNRTLLNLVDRRALDLGFGETSVREANFEASLKRRARVDGKTEARPQHEADRHKQTNDAGLVAFDVVDSQCQDRRLPGLRTEIASRVTNLLVGRRIPAADLGPVVLRRHQIDLDRSLRRRRRGLILSGRGGGRLGGGRGRRTRGLFRLRESVSPCKQKKASQTGCAEAFQREGHQISFPMIGLSQPPLLRPPGDGNRCGNETTLADPPGARTAVKTGARLHASTFGFIASVSIIGLACKPRSGFQLGEFKGARFPAKAWSKPSAATLRKACLEMKGVPWRQPARGDPSCHGSRLTSKRE